MNWEEYEAARRVKMAAIYAAREKQKPVEQIDEHAAELARVIEALTATGGNVESAAELLKVSRATLFRRVKLLGINARAIRKKAAEVAMSAGTTGTPDRER